MTEQITAIQSKQSIVCDGEIIDLSTPRVMGIVNITPDSFFDGGKLNNEKALLLQVEKHLSEGATFIDLGAVSSKPGADEVTQAEELNRLYPALRAIRSEFPKAIISVDTFRSHVAEQAIENGAHMINDISGGMLDRQMFETIAKLQVPYVLMHMKGNPQTMSNLATYENVLDEVFDFLLQQSHALKQLGVHDVILDPGFGFAKNLEQNYQLLHNLDRINEIGLPMLVGVSRKSMINKVLKTKPENALNGTTVLNTIALQKGVGILRVHDVKEAVECIKLWTALNGNSSM